MATTHAKYMRCLVWQTALRHWKEFRTILFKKIELRIRRLYALMNDFKRQYKLLNEPDVGMTKAYQVAGYYHQISMHASVRRMRNKSKSSVNEEKNVESIDKRQEYNLAALTEYICTGEDSQDEFEQENSKSKIAPSAPTANVGGADEHGQECSGSQGASSSASSAPKEKYTGTKPKNVKRLQRSRGELVSASNIQVPHAIENLKHATAVLDLSLRRKNNADDEKTKKDGQTNYRKKDEIRDTGVKICAPTPPPRKKEPPPDRRKVCSDTDDEDNKVPIPLPRNEEEAAALDLSMNNHCLLVEPLPPKLPELPSDFQSKIDYTISFLESYTKLHNKLEMISELDPTMRKGIKIAMQEELQKHLDRNQFLMNGVEWVKLGKYKTKIKKKVLCEVDWTLGGFEITRHLLMHIFDRKTLETHNLKGEGHRLLAGDEPIAEMSILDKHAVTDLTDFIFIMKGLPSKMTRDIIDDTCAEFYKAKVERVEKERELKSKMHKHKKSRKPQRKYGRRR